MRYTPLLALLILVSCRTTKVVTKETIKVDSSLVRENATIRQTLASTIEQYEQLLRDSSGVIIQYADGPTDSIPYPVYLPGKVTIDRAGVIQAEGRLKSIQFSNTRLAQESSRKDATIDSQAVVIDLLTAEVNKEVKNVEKEVVRNVIPLWIWIVLGVTLGIAIFKEEIPFIRNIKLPKITLNV